MQIQNLSTQILNYSNGNGELVTYLKDGERSVGIASVAGEFVSAWTMHGRPVAGAVPTTPAAPDKTTTGALFFTNPTAGQNKWATKIAMIIGSAGTLYFYDRLLHSGGLDGTSTALQNVGGTLTRFTGTASAGNRAFIEIYTAIGTTATTLTVNYTDQGGTSRTTTVPVIGGTNKREVGRLIGIPALAGTKGFRSVDSVQLGATTGTAGNFGITIMRPLFESAATVSGTCLWNAPSSKPGGIEIPSDACISSFIFATSTFLRKFGAYIHTVRC